MNPGALDGEVMHAGGGPQRIRNAVQLDGDAGPGEMSQPEQRAGLDDRADLMMLTRSHSASISDRMWLDSSTVRPRPLGLMQSWNTASINGSSPVVGSSMISSSTSEASAATMATFCLLPWNRCDPSSADPARIARAIRRGGGCPYFRAGGPARRSPPFSRTDIRRARQLRRRGSTRRKCDASGASRRVQPRHGR